MSEILKFKEEKLPPLDLKAGRQIFDKEYTREDKDCFATIPRNSSNPIDVMIRALCLSSLDGSVNLRPEFFDKWVVIQTGMDIVKGRVKDIFIHSRDVYVKTRKGEVYIVPFDNVKGVYEREPA